MAKMGYTEAQQEGAWEGQGLSSNSSMRRVKMGHWSPDEDNKLTNYIMRNGLRGCWNYIAKQAGLQRCGKSCRLRWINYLRPGLKRGSFSSQEELLIIHLQSTLGNRWSQIAAHLPGRTDNEIKNYWYSAIKKKCKLKNEPPFSNIATSEEKNIKSNLPFQSDIICNADSMTAHVHDIVSSSHSAQPYLEVMQPVEEYQQHNNTFNILLAAGENQFCVPGELEFKQEAQNQSDESFIYTHTIHTTLISPGPQGQGLYNYKSARSSTWEDFILESCRTTVPLHVVPGSANDYFLSSPGINSIPALVEGQTWKEKIQNNGHTNKNEIMKDYSLFTASSGISAWSPACHYYSNIAADFADVCSDVSYSDELLGDRVLEDLVSVHDEKSGHQPYSPLNFVSQVSAPSIKGDNNLDAGDDWKDRRNLGYDANSMYCDINSTWQRNHQIEGGGIGDQLDHTKFSIEKANRKPIPAIFGEGSVALESGAGQVTVWAQEDMCNINTAAASCPDRIYFS